MTATQLSAPTTSFSDFNRRCKYIDRAKSSHAYAALDWIGRKLVDAVFVILLTENFDDVSNPKRYACERALRSLKARERSMRSSVMHGLDVVYDCLPTDDVLFARPQA